MDRFDSVYQKRYLLISKYTTARETNDHTESTKRANRSYTVAKIALIEWEEVLIKILSLIDQCCVGVRRVKITASWLDL
jgi:hypothetical protein